MQQQLCGHSKRSNMVSVKFYVLYSLRVFVSHVECSRSCCVLAMVLQTAPEQGKQLKDFISLSEILIPTCQEASTEMKPAVYFDNDFQSSVLTNTFLECFTQRALFTRCPGLRKRRLRSDALGSHYLQCLFRKNQTRKSLKKILFS